MKYHRVSYHYYVRAALLFSMDKWEETWRWIQTLSIVKSDTYEAWILEDEEETV